MCFRGLSLRGMAVRCARLKLSIGLIVATGILTASPWASSVRAQGIGGIGGFGNIRVVGGVSISPEGVLRTATQEDQTLALSEMRAQLIGPQGQLNQPAERRLISLKNLQKIIT